MSTPPLFLARKYPIFFSKFCPRNVILGLVLRLQKITVIIGLIWLPKKWQKKWPRFTEIGTQKNQIGKSGGERKKKS